MSRRSPDPKTAPENAQHSGVPWASLCLLLLAFAGLCCYLFRPVQISGDGAVYSLQALDGSPWERSVHVGALAPLWFWVRVLGLPPGLLSACWTALALVASAGVGARLLRLSPRAPELPPAGALAARAPLLAPLCILGAAVTWENALFVEIYAALAALTLTCLWALLAGRGLLAGLALAWAAAAHPGVWVLVPGLLLLAGPSLSRRPGKTARMLVVAVLGHGLILALLYPDWWSGGRGLAQLPPADQNLWEALQALWRLLSRDLALAAVPALAGLLALRRRQLLGMLWVVVGSALVLCRFSDNPGGLPALWLLACLAPLSLRWLEGLDGQRLRAGTAAGVLVLLVFGIGDATSLQDARARGAEAEHRARAEEGCPPASDLPWSLRALQGLACRERAAGGPTPGPR